MTFSIPNEMVAIKKLEDAPGLTACEGVPIPPIGPREVLIAVTHAGICGTDRHIYEWDAWSRNRVPLGITTGHEFVGRVVAVGSAVERAEVGQRVSAEGHIGCGHCPPCRTGKAHICDRVDIIGIDRDGCFAQYVAVPEENLWLVHPSIPDHWAALFDPLGNAVHTVMAAGVSSRSVLITGVGIIGLMAVAVARAAGASKILAADIDPRRLELAKKLGADEAFDCRQSDWTEQVLAATAGQGPEVLLEMSGHGETIRRGLRVTRNGGKAALLGLPAEPVPLDLPNEVIFKGLTILGINGRLMFETWYQAENLLTSGRLDLEPIVTHQLTLQEIDHGVQLMQQGAAIKVVLHVAHDQQLPESSVSAEAGSETSVSGCGRRTSFATTK